MPSNLDFRAPSWAVFPLGHSVTAISGSGQRGRAWTARFAASARTPAGNVVLLILATLLGRLLFAMWVGLGIDESYMVAAARHFRLGYFDHPPVAWWLVWVSTHLFGSEFEPRRPAPLPSPLRPEHLADVPARRLPVRERCRALGGGPPECRAGAQRHHRFMGAAGRAAGSGSARIRAVHGACARRRGSGMALVDRRRRVCSASPSRPNTWRFRSAQARPHTS